MRRRREPHDDGAWLTDRSLVDMSRRRQANVRDRDRVADDALTGLRRHASGSGTIRVARPWHLRRAGQQRRQVLPRSPFAASTGPASISAPRTVMAGTMVMRLIAILVPPCTLTNTFTYARERVQDYVPLRPTASQVIVSLR